MIYWYTGQPGHGKTLHAIDRLLQFRDAGRVCYACNIRGFDYQKTGVLEMTPDQFRDWPNFLPDGAVVLVDEAYQHGMLPKRPPSSMVPRHVEQLAVHRHRGLDFIFVSQSPDKQCDQFVQDLIERHIHVRRRFGTRFVHLREFDRYEANAEKAVPLVLRRAALPKRPMGLYSSTELDTTERRIPWYMFAFPLGAALAVFLMYYTFGDMGARLGGDPSQAVSDGGASAPNGAPATVGVTGANKSITPADYVAKYIPRISSQPWSAPAYDQLKPPSEAPRVFCMSSGPGSMETGYSTEDTCSCVTEQGTKYVMPLSTCRMIARNGQYEPLFDERNTRLMRGEDQIEESLDIIDGARPSSSSSFSAPVSAPSQVAQYGMMRAEQPGPSSYTVQ